MDVCSECGFDYGKHPPAVAVSELALLGGRFRLQLSPSLAGEFVTQRPSKGVWSPLEYACHVRDVLLAQRERLFLALVEDCPSFAPIYRDERVLLARYAAEEPAAVIAQLEMAASMIAYAFAGLTYEQWQRECIYNYPEPARRSLGWLAAHSLHEGEHHLRDIRAQLDRE
jgi:hypothetical protein